MAACLWGGGGRSFVSVRSGAFRGLPSVCVFSYFPFAFEGRIWDLIVSVPDHCLSFSFGRTHRVSAVGFLVVPAFQCRSCCQVLTLFHHLNVES